MITAALVLALVLFIGILASGNSWSNVLSTTRNDLVFAQRNRAYGAYAMRREHHGVMLIAFFASLGLVSAGLVLPELLATSAPQTLIAPPVGVDVELEKFQLRQHVKVEKTTTTTTKRKNPDDMIVPIAVDSTVHTPIDTTSNPVDLGPKAPLGPEGPKGPGPGDTGAAGPDPNTILDGWAADVAPEYPGGLTALYDDLQDMVRYPDIDLDAGRQGRVTVGFVVAQDGAITEVAVMKGVSPTLDAEAVRVVRKLKKWKPGQFKGRDVNVRFSLPIVFKLAKQ